MNKLAKIISVPFICIAFVAIVITSKLQKIGAENKEFDMYIGSNGDLFCN